MISTLEMGELYFNTADFKKYRNKNSHTTKVISEYLESLVKTKVKIRWLL